MKRPSRQLLAVPTLVLLNCLAGAVAQAAVYRCGSVYQDTPCAQGQPQREVDVPPPPTEADQAAAHARAQTDIQRARDLTQAQRQQERLNVTTQQAVPLSRPRANEDDMLTDCRRKPTTQVPWSKRKQEYCASHLLVVKKKGHRTTKQQIEDDGVTQPWSR